MPDGGSGHTSAGLVEPAAAPPPASAPRRRWQRPTGIAVGLLALLTGLLVPFAPVVADDVTVTWPRQGEPPESTLAFLVPYHPSQVHVHVPCPVVRAGLQRGVPTTVVSSNLPGHPTNGFAVTTAGDTVLVLLAGKEALRVPAGPDCDVTIDADRSGSTAQVGAHRVALPGERVRDVVVFATDLTPQQATGIDVRVRTANWFENSPSTAKSSLITAQLVLAAVAFALLVAQDRGRRRRRTARPRGHPLRLLVDVALLAVLGGWWVFGPVTADDSFAGTTIRNALHTGDVGNYYRWENASEAPFTLAQRLLEPVAALSANPLVLRVPSVLAGLLTWLVLSRGVLGPLLPEHSRRFWFRALAAVAFLAWWLPFGLGVRPEPFAALLLTAVFAAVLQAVQQQRTAWLGVAVLAAGLAVSVNAMGITAIAPFIALAGPIRRMLSVPTAALLAGIGATGVVAMFADQSLAGTAAATRLHEHYGPDVPWFQEILRYQYLLGFDSQGDVARRLPVLLTAVLAVHCGLVLLRGANRLTAGHAHAAPVVFGLSLLLMALTPSKWTHYFGALAGIGAATLVTSAVLVAVAARQLRSDRVVLVGGAVSAVLAALAAALSFAGKNNWFLHSHYGVPWGEQPVRPLNNPLLWLVATGAVLAISSAAGDFRRALVRAPAVVGTAAVAAGVLLVLFSFAIAPLRQSGSYSTAAQNLAALSGRGSCGIADHVVVTPDVPGGVLRPDGPAEAVGFDAGGGYAEAPPGGTEHVWGSLAGSPLSTGRLTTGWFALPPLADDQELAVPAAGRTGDGNQVVLEYGSPSGVIGSRVLDDTHLDPDEIPAYPTDHVVEDEPQDNPAWRDFPVPAREIPPGTDRVRIRAVDATTDPGGWVAVAAPRVREAVPLAEYLRGKGPVLVDWSMTWSAPCLQDMPRVGSGLVEPPAYLVTSPSALGFGGTAAYTRSIGGSFAGVVETGQQTDIPTRLPGVTDRPEYPEWGRLVKVDYPYPADGYDVHRVAVTRWGWRGE